MSKYLHLKNEIKRNKMPKMDLDKIIKQEPIEDEDNIPNNKLKELIVCKTLDVVKQEDLGQIKLNDINPKIKVEKEFENLNHVTNKLKVIIKEEIDDIDGNSVKLTDGHSAIVKSSLSCGIGPFKIPDFNSSHSIETPCICMACDLKFNEKVQLTNHMFQHIQKKAYPCSLCSMGFDNSNEIADHMNIHYGYRTACDHCGKAFEDRNNIVIHFSTCSPQTVQGRLYCDICNEQFIDEGLVIKHMLTHTQEKSYICTICGECSQTKSELKGHMFKHTGGKPYSCSTCGKCFATRHVAKRHANDAHTTGTPFICQICGNMFRLEKYLKRHMQIHQEHSPYICNICGNRYKCFSSLYSHKVRHPEFVKKQR